MKYSSKRLKKEKSKVNKNESYNIERAIHLVKKTTSTKFNESIEAHFS
jgi:ribosomal protein L1